MDDLIERCGYQVVLTGAGPQEIQIISDIRNFTKGSFIDLSGKTPLRILMGLIANAAVVVGTDTGPTHIAAALGVPVVSVSPTKFVKSLRWGPWRTPNRVVSASAACDLVCRPYHCKKTICLDAIPYSRATDAILEVVADAVMGRPRVPTKHQWIQTSMHSLVYWSGRESQLPIVVAQYRALVTHGFVVHLGTRSWKFRRRLMAELGITVDRISVIQPFDWVGMVWELMTKDVTVVFVVGPVVHWYWFWIRQLAALRQYCPPTMVSVTEPAQNKDDILLLITAAIYH
ncbi:hypothetical protein EBR57_04725 [bacterium]|nr:hypothetical protein [bacterium]